MGTYTVTITPDAGVGAEAAVRIDIDSGVVRIVELVVRPHGGPPRNGSTAAKGRLSGESFDLILRAVQPALAAVDAMQRETGEEARVAAEPVRTRREPRGRAVRRGRPGRGARPAEETRTTARGAGRKATTRAAAEGRDTATGKPGGRAYRRMPDDLAENLARIGSVTRLAAHYGVPRHTAQGWVGRLRKEQGS